jgi:hypothetical protein
MHDLSENAAAFDGVSAYDAGDHWHFVTYGLTELYGKENKNSDVSGFGYEFTFKLPKVSDAPPPWASDSGGLALDSACRGARGRTIRAPLVGGWTLALDPS